MILTVIMWSDSVWRSDTVEGLLKLHGPIKPILWKKGVLFSMYNEYKTRSEIGNVFLSEGNWIRSNLL